ncbi:hypothetical protein lerEdw1_006991, partial [Lerista edwardsae]
EDEEEYECPDSETEIKNAGPFLYANNAQQGNKNLIQDPLAEDDNYENTQEEVKQRDVNSCERSLYENRQEEMKSVSPTWGSAGPLYANNTQQDNKNLIQDPLVEGNGSQDDEETIQNNNSFRTKERSPKISSVEGTHAFLCFPVDAENYENVEETVCLSPGAARLIAGLQLALSSNLDKQDVGSEASTDADSYENMESPNSFNSRKEDNLDPHGEASSVLIWRNNIHFWEMKLKINLTVLKAAQRRPELQQPHIVMPRRCGFLPWLLLLLIQLTWADLRVSVPLSPIRARPGSDARLPCNISDSSGPLSLSKLAVLWKIGEKLIAQYEEGFRPMRPGAVMSVEQLLKGDATLLLQDVQYSDASVYSCIVIHMPNKGEGNVELKVEAPPHLTLSSTKVQLAKSSAVTCTMSEFYPSHISVEWLRNDVVVKGPESPLPQTRPDGLFSAESVLQLTPQLADVNATFSCRVRHQDLDGLLKKDFQLQVQARPVIQDLIVLEGEDLIAAKCIVSGFYPKEVKVRWLRNGVSQETMRSELQQMPNGTFTIHCSILQLERDPTASYVCQVLHETLNDPLNLTAHWQPKGESEEIICPTSPTAQSTEKTLICQRSQPTLTPPSSTGFPSSPGCSELYAHPYVIGLTIASIAGIALGAAGTVAFYKIQEGNRDSGTVPEVLKGFEESEEVSCP